MADRSADWTLNVPPADPTVIDLEPLGISETVFPTAETEPEKATSLAVMVTGPDPDVLMPVETALVTLPVPSVVMVTPPPLPVTWSLSVIDPFDPDEVCRTTVAPPIELDVVMEPLAIRVNAPLPEFTIPDVPMVAEAPVVVTEKLPPTDDVPIVTAPVLVMVAVPGLPVLAVRIFAAV